MSACKRRTSRRIVQAGAVNTPTKTAQKVLTPEKPHETDSEDDITKCTPPKLKKRSPNNENASPTTPSGLIQRLSIGEKSIGEKTSRQQLFKDNDVYQSARKALHGSSTSTLPGREKELEKLQAFIKEHLEGGTSGSLYISGPPGTGKTAALNLIIEDEQISSKLQNVYVNCTAIKSSAAIYSRICKDLNIKTTNSSGKDHAALIEHYLQKKHKPILLVLDEIDQLESKNQSVLYTIFEWPSIKNSKLILIGIANALDLTDRTLPRLQSHLELKPELMHFAPYTKQEILEILKSRLISAGALEVIPLAGLQMLAGKVAAVSGDVRRALDIGRRVVDLATRQKQDAVLKSVENVGKLVGLKEVVDVLNHVYGSTSQNMCGETDEAFPLQQKIVICCLVLILRKGKSKDITVGRLQEVYRKVCVKRNVQAVDQDFFGLCSLIETKGIIKIIKKKDLKLSKVSLVWDEEEVVHSLKDKMLVSTILDDFDCLKI